MCRSIWWLLCVAVIGGLIVDCLKPVWWPEWAGYRSSGNSIFVWYALFNVLGGALAWTFLVLIADWYVLYLAMGMALLLPGVLANTLELGLIPIVWHGAIGFFAALTVAFRRFFADLLERWSRVPLPQHGADEQNKSALEVRKELVKEMQWAFTTHLQVWIAFTAIFGVSMTILFKDGQINKTDLKATAVQMTMGFSTCLLLAYWFGIAYALRIMQTVRHRWADVILQQSGSTQTAVASASHTDNPTI